MIKIDFEFNTEHGIFRDALYLEENHQLSDSEIEEMKIQRRDNWITAITTPPLEEANPEYIEIDGVTYMRVETNG